MRSRRPERERLEALLSRFGTHTASYVLLEGNKCYLTLPDVEGFVAWETRAGCPVIAGDPVCDPRQAARLLRAVRWRAFPRPVFAYAATPGMEAAYREAGFGTVPIGAEPVFDPRSFSLAGGARATVRAAVNHAVKAGLSVVEHDPQGEDAAAVNREITGISDQWLADRGDDELGFLLGRPALDRKTRKRYFVARSAGRIEGFLVCEPVLTRNGWYLDVTRRRGDAVRGTMELLTTSALQTFGVEGASFASMGLAPLARLEEPGVPPGDSQRLMALLRRAFRELQSPYDFRDLARYKSKYAPDAWEPRLLCYSGSVAERVARLAISVASRRSAKRGSPDPSETR
ncbi:MAG: bifunctional lysylphosphatidylglycerol flippase/synthetase MprF [Gemmatimonadaceae bacterium]